MLIVDKELVNIKGNKDLADYRNKMVDYSPTKFWGARHRTPCVYGGEDAIIVDIDWCMKKMGDHDYLQNGAKSDEGHWKRAMVAIGKTDLALAKQLIKDFKAGAPNFYKTKSGGLHFVYGNPNPEVFKKRTIAKVAPGVDVFSGRGNWVAAYDTSYYEAIVKGEVEPEMYAGAETHWEVKQKDGDDELIGIIDAEQLDTILQEFTRDAFHELVYDDRRNFEFAIANGCGEDEECFNVFEAWAGGADDERDVEIMNCWQMNAGGITIKSANSIMPKSSRTLSKLITKAEVGDWPGKPEGNEPHAIYCQNVDTGSYLNKSGYPNKVPNAVIPLPDEPFTEPKQKRAYMDRFNYECRALVAEHLCEVPACDPEFNTNPETQAEYMRDFFPDVYDTFVHIQGSTVELSRTGYGLISGNKDDAARHLLNGAQSDLIKSMVQAMAMGSKYTKDFKAFHAFLINYFLGMVTEAKESVRSMSDWLYSPNFPERSRFVVVSNKKGERRAYKLFPDKGLVESDKPIRDIRPAVILNMDEFPKFKKNVKYTEMLAADVNLCKLLTHAGAAPDDKENNRMHEKLLPARLAAFLALAITGQLNNGKATGQRGLFTILSGAPGSGKSTIIEMLADIDHRLVTNLEPKTFNRDNRFGFANSEAAHVLFLDEAPNMITQNTLGAIKRVTDSQRRTVENKGENATPVLNRASFVFACNDDMTVEPGIDTAALDQRLSVIHFKKSVPFSDMDAELGQNIRNNLHNWYGPLVSWFYGLTDGQRRDILFSADPLDPTYRDSLVKGTKTEASL